METIINFIKRQKIPVFYRGCYRKTVYINNPGNGDFMLYCSLF